MGLSTVRRGLTDNLRTRCCILELGVAPQVALRPQSSMGCVSRAIRLLVWLFGHHWCKLDTIGHFRTAPMLLHPPYPWQRYPRQQVGQEQGQEMGRVTFVMVCSVLGIVREWRVSVGGWSDYTHLTADLHHSQG